MRTSASLVSVALFSIALLASTSAALADIPPTDTSGCRDKKAGEVCQTDDRKTGACATSQCERMDRSKQPYEMVKYACLKCQGSGDTTSGGSSSGGSSGGQASGGTSGGSASSGGTGKSGCATAPSSRTSGDVSALALALAALVVVRRKRAA
jgi:uncharacterized membrane protein YgcG